MAFRASISCLGKKFGHGMERLCFGDGGGLARGAKVREGGEELNLQERCLTHGEEEERVKNSNRSTEKDQERTREGEEKKSDAREDRSSRVILSREKDTDEEVFPPNHCAKKRGASSRKSFSGTEGEFGVPAIQGGKRVDVPGERKALSLYRAVPLYRGRYSNKKGD